MASRRQRLTAEERREAIVRAVIPVFAEKGFHAATTKELAQAADVSEALLYRHFPSKQKLFAAISSHHFEDEDDHPGYAELLAMASLAMASSRKPYSVRLGVAYSSF
jgi:AcrR family transcriptional regulator